MSGRPSRRAAAAKAVKYTDADSGDDEGMLASSSGSEAEFDFGASKAAKGKDDAVDVDGDEEEAEAEQEEQAPVSRSRSGRVRKQVERFIAAEPSPKKKRNPPRGKGKRVVVEKEEEEEEEEDVEEPASVAAKCKKGGGGFDMSAYIKTAAAKPKPKASEPHITKARAGGGGGSKRRGAAHRGKQQQQQLEDDEFEEEDNESSDEEGRGGRRRRGSRGRGRGRRGKGKKKEEEGVRRSARQGAGGARRYTEEELFAGLDDASASSESESEEDEGPKRGGSRGGGRKKAAAAAESSEEEDDDDQPLPRLLARRSLTPAEWRGVCAGMNTAEITRGSLWLQEEADWASESPEPVEKFLCRWSGMSYLHVSWETAADLVHCVGPHAKAAIKRFLTREAQGNLDYGSGFGGDAEDGEYFDAQFAEIDRVLAVETDDEEDDKGSKEASPSKKEEEGDEEGPGQGWEAVEKGSEEGEGKGAKSSSGASSEQESAEGEKEKRLKCLVKWCGLPYHECTWEKARDLKGKGLEAHVAAYRRRQEVPPVYAEEASLEFAKAAYEAQPPYKGGGELRPYQWESVQWMCFNWSMNQGSILADEMGLGKTVQTVAFIHSLVEKQRARGPFLVIAPLSTLQHWYREFSGWTDLNTIVYHGSAEDRAECRASEWWFDDGVLESFFEAHGVKGGKRRGGRGGGGGKLLPKFQVLITTPEMILAQDANQLAQLPWEVLVVDEAHRLKNDQSRLCRALREDFGYRSAVLLTGTPLQNNTEELWTLLNFACPDTFPDKGVFEAKYGDIKDQESLQALQQAIRPFLLRRMKEDVEKNLPPKEETIIDVEMTAVQKQYYRAIYEKNFSVLTGGRKAADGPSLMNVAMELRKCCNHPFLVRGVEQDIRNHAAATGKSYESDADLLVEYSGKLVLLDKLLPKLKAADHRVLIFSQFKIMLDVLEDYLGSRGFSFGRVDGSVTGDKRQAAIDDYNKPGSSTFVMLLSTKAGGVGINLTSADTCIIFDSDWNPQNDIQAQARCHRIGQKKEVKIFRLITSKTYEQHMFHVASLKLGLDHAVLQSIESSTAISAASASGASGANDGRMSKEELERLLRHGAYDVFQEEREGEDASKKFCEDDIDAILQKRATKIVHDAAKSKDGEGKSGGGHSNSFSKASFALSNGAAGLANNAVSVDDNDFWEKVVGMRVAAQQAAQGGAGGGERGRRCKQGKKNYREPGLQNLHQEVDSDSEAGSRAAAGEDEEDEEDEATALSYAALNRLVTALHKHGYPTYALPTATPTPAPVATDATAPEGDKKEEGPGTTTTAAVAPTPEPAAAATALLLKRWRAVGEDAKLKRRHAPLLRTLSRHLVAALVRAAAKQRVQERKREEAKKAAHAQAAAEAANAKEGEGEVVDLLSPPTQAAAAPVAAEGEKGKAVEAAGPIPVVLIPDVTPEELQAECIKVLELIPVARLVLADLEASTLGTLQEPALEEEDEEEGEEVEVMDVDGGEKEEPPPTEEGAAAKAEEAEAAPVEAAAEPQPMEEGTDGQEQKPAAVEVVVIPSQSQEDAASPAASATDAAKPHPRVPGKWDAAEFARVAGWVLDLPLPPHLDEEDLEKAPVKKAYAKLQAIDDAWLLDRLSAALALPDSAATTTYTTQAGKDAKHLRALTGTAAPAPKYPAPWWDAASARRLLAAMADLKSVRVTKSVYEKVQAAFPPALRPLTAPPAPPAPPTAAAVEGEAAPEPEPAAEEAPAAVVGVAWPPNAKVGAYFRLLLEGFRKQDLIERGEMAAPAPAPAATKGGAGGKRKRATSASSSSASGSSMAAPLGPWRPPTANSSAPPAPLFFRPISAASSTASSSGASSSTAAIAASVKPTTTSSTGTSASSSPAAKATLAAAAADGVIGGNAVGVVLKASSSSSSSSSPPKAQATMLQLAAAKATAPASAEKRKREELQQEEGGSPVAKKLAMVIDMTAAAATTPAAVPEKQQQEEDENEKGKANSASFSASSSAAAPGVAPTGDNAREEKAAAQPPQQPAAQKKAAVPAASSSNKAGGANGGPKQSSLMRFLQAKKPAAAAAAPAPAAPANAPMEVVEVVDDASSPVAATAAPAPAPMVMEEEPN